jgi:small-conductance mechanosensitive channel
MRGLDFQALLSTLTSTVGAIQITAFAVCVALAWLISGALKRRLPGQLEPGIAKIGTGSAHRVVMPALLLVLVWLARLGLSKFQSVHVLDLAVPLISAFAVIRLAVYLLRHMIAPSALLKSSERIIVLFVWLLIALHLTGLLAEIASALEQVVLPMGSKKVTLLLVVEALLSVIVTVFVAMGLSGLIEARVMRAETLDASSRVVIGKIVRAVALTLAILIALPLAGIDLTLLSVFGGALGVGLGFGLQKIASNYISGFIILLDRSIRLGDLVTIDKQTGVVEAIKSRYTVVRGLDGTEAIVPNDTIITSTVTNHSYTHPKVAVKITLTIGYDSSLERARELLVEISLAHPRVLQDPAPAALVTALGDNGIELELVVWINDPDLGQGALRSDLLVSVWQAFRDNHISIPDPQRELRLQTSGPTDPKAGISPTQ